MPWGRCVRLSHTTGGPVTCWNFGPWEGPRWRSIVSSMWFDLDPVEPSFSSLSLFSASPWFLGPGLGDDLAVEDIRCQMIPYVMLHLIYPSYDCTCTTCSHANSLPLDAERLASRTGMVHTTLPGLSSRSSCSRKRVLTGLDCVTSRN